LKCEDFEAREVWQTFQHSSRPLLFW